MLPGELYTNYKVTINLKTLKNIVGIMVLRNRMEDEV